MATFTQDGVLLEDEPTADPDIHKVKVPHGMAPPDFVTDISAGFPSADYDTWYYPTQLAYLMGKVGALADTAQELPGKFADVFDEMGTGGKWIVAGLGLLVVLEVLKRTK